MIDMVKKDLEGMVVLITGASSGIGKAIAQRFAEEGADLSLASRSSEKLERIAKELEDKYKIETLVNPTDIREEEQIKNMVKKTVDRFGRLDILVNNAGIIRYGDIEDLTTEDYRAVMETNIDGMFFSTREALSHLRESEGNLIFIGSFDANHPRSFNPIYAASKWWTKGFAHSIESIVGEDGVAVTLVNPSEVRTTIKSEEGEEYKEKFDEREVTEPEDIAEVVIFAAKQDKPNTLSQVDVYRRDKLSDFF